MRKKRAFNITCGAVLAGSLPGFFGSTELTKADNPGALSDVASTSEVLSKSLKIIKVPAVIVAVASLGLFIVYKIFQIKFIKDYIYYKIFQIKDISCLRKFIDDYDASEINEKFEEAVKKDREKAQRKQSLENEKFSYGVFNQFKKPDLEELKEIFKEVEEIAKDVWVNKGYNQKTNEVGLGSDFLNTEKLNVLGEDVVFLKGERLVPRLLKVSRAFMKKKGELPEEKNIVFPVNDIGKFVKEFFDKEEFKNVRKKAPCNSFHFCNVLELMKIEIEENKSEEERKEELKFNEKRLGNLDEEIRKLEGVDPEFYILKKINEDYKKARDIIEKGVKDADVFLKSSEYMKLRENFDKWHSNENPA